MAPVPPGAIFLSRQSAHFAWIPESKKMTWEASLLAFTIPCNCMRSKGK